MSSFVSTRGSDRATLTEAILRGPARDGGLYVPVESTELPAGSPPSPDLAEVACWAAPSFFPDLDPGTLRSVVTEALPFPIPLVEVESGVHVLELFHGPTLAFKDVGARFLAGLTSAIGGRDESRTVLVATSGDTGSAVAAAFHGRPQLRVVVLFPRDGVSARQRRQMTTLGGNVTAVAVRGTFDDCQRVTRAAFADADSARRHGLLSANSINAGRLLPQALYYVYAAAVLGWSDRPPRFVVPSGNLGNLCAGLIARQRGMPAAGFLAAVNVNRGFLDFLELGSHEPRSSMPTSSSAMDVGDPSNLERIRWLYSDDVGALRRDVSAISVSDEETAECIRSVHERSGYVLDPHSAVAYEAQRRDHGRGDGPTVVLATAHPAKFPYPTRAAIGADVSMPDALARTLEKEERMLDMEPTLDALRSVLRETAG